MLDMACPPDPCGGPNAVTLPMTAVPGSVGFGVGMPDATSDATLSLSEAPLVERIEAGVRKGLGLYRELVKVEIGRASEYGARWWSRRLVQVYVEAGLVRLER
jgi:hypothetical protein